MSAFLDGLGFGFARGMLNNMFGFGGFRGFWGSPFGCCCMPFNMSSLFIIPRLNFTNLYQYPTVMPQINLPTTVSMPSLNFSAPNISVFSNFNILAPAMDFSNVPSYYTGDSFTKSTVLPITEQTRSEKKHWSKMTDTELRNIYGNYEKDITSSYNGNADKLNEYIEKFERKTGKQGVLHGMGKEFIKAQETYGINAAVLLAICIHESACGTSDLAKSSKHNVSSLTTNNKNDRWRKFESVEDCIDKTAKYLKDNYVTNSGVSGKSLTKLYEINAKYCPVADPTDNTGNNKNWAKAVDKYTSEIENLA